VVPLGAHLPGGDLCGISFGVPVVSAPVQPVSIVVNMELFKFSELVERVML